MSTIINDPFHAAIVLNVLNELSRSKAKHPNYPIDTLRRESIIMEEGLEAAHQLIGRLMILQQVTLGVTRISSKDLFSQDDLRKELIQTAAMCFKMLESMMHEEQQANVGDH